MRDLFLDCLPGFATSEQETLVTFLLLYPPHEDIEI